MIPVHNKATEAIQDTRANFGLFYNKYTEIDEAKLKTPDDGKSSWKERYEDTKRKNGEGIRTLLKKRHNTQHEFCRFWKSKGCQSIILHARIASPMIIGLGESHPGETGILLERNLGIPYIPASTIKGVVRFAHTIGLLKDENGVWLDRDALQDKLDLFEKDNQILLKENDKTHIPQLFGQTEKDSSARGSIIFLDAYPVDIPNLKVDIMNPHYSEYYQGTRGPTEDQNPIPLKFLVVEEGAEFVFRAIVKPPQCHGNDQTSLLSHCREAYRQALTEEGVGAKTALGYGRFREPCEGEPNAIKEYLQQIEAEKEKARERERQLQDQARFEQMTPDEKFLLRIKQLKKDTQMISDLCKACEDQSNNREVFQALKAKLQELEEWKPDGSKQKKEKMRARNAAIENKINSL